jgi:hypothetical protein
MKLAEDWNTWYNILIGMPIIIVLFNIQVWLFRRISKDFNSTKVEKLTDYCNKNEVK